MVAANLSPEYVDKLETDKVVSVPASAIHNPDDPLGSKEKVADETVYCLLPPWMRVDQKVMLELDG